MAIQAPTKQAKRRRDLPPGSVFGSGLAYQAAGSLSGFNGSVANGEWTLFFADMAAGGGQAQLTGWSLDITAVPEPVNVAMAIFGVGFIGVGAVRGYRNSRKATLPIFVVGRLK